MSLTDVEGLFQRIYPALVRFLFRRVGDLDRAEDIAQEAFVRLLKQKPAKPEGWLFIVAANLARDHQRRDTRQTRRLVLFANESVSDGVPEPTVVGFSDESVARLRDALQHLSERDRNLLLLHQEGLSYKQLADVVSVKPSSVAPLLARARKRLLRAIGTYTLTADADDSPDDSEDAYANASA